MDVQQLDDEAIEAEVRRFAGEQAPGVLAALKPWRGPERLIDLQLRIGHFGVRPQAPTASTWPG